MERRIGPGGGLNGGWAMARHRSFGSEFKRQLAKEFLDGRPGLHELARRHSHSRNLIRLWIRKYETGEFSDEMARRFRIMKLARSTYYHRSRVVRRRKSFCSAASRAVCRVPPRRLSAHHSPAPCGRNGGQSQSGRKTDAPKWPPGATLAQVRTHHGQRPRRSVLSQPRRWLPPNRHQSTTVK
jgi:transposase-like protein